MKFTLPCVLFAACCALTLDMVAMSDEPAKSAGHRLIAADKGHVAIVSAQGEVEWETPTKADVHDLWLLPDGNILFLYGPAKVVEINPAKVVVWEYEARPKNDSVKRVEVHAFQRLADGLTMIAE